MDVPRPVNGTPSGRDPRASSTWEGRTEVVDDLGGDGAASSWTALLVHGSFFLATCWRCEWTGAARRARHTALRDALRHRQACPGPAGRTPVGPPASVVTTR